MKKILVICTLFTVLSCTKTQIPEPITPSTTTIDSTTVPSDTLVVDTIIINPDTIIIPGEILFKSILDDSVSYESDSIDENGVLIYESNTFRVIIKTRNVDSVQVGFYMNEFLLTNSGFGIDLSHGVYLGDGSIAGMSIGSSATQINILEVTKIEGDRVWFTFDIDWTYTHWLYTDRNKSGTIVGEINGYKYK